MQFMIWYVDMDQINPEFNEGENIQSKCCFSTTTKKKKKKKERKKRKWEKEKENKKLIYEWYDQ